MKKAYIGLGSNIEPRLEYLNKAVTLLRQGEGIRVTRLSSIYETDPVDYLHQPDFLNRVVELQTTLDPKALLYACQHMEEALKREHIIDKGPRNIDLDILFYGAEQVKQTHLEIPHPRIEQRAFVLVPLHELAPELEHPILKQSIRELLSRLSHASIAGVKQWDER